MKMKYFWNEKFLIEPDKNQEFLLKFHVDCDSYKYLYHTKRY